MCVNAERPCLCNCCTHSTPTDRAHLATYHVSAPNHSNFNNHVQQQHRKAIRMPMHAATQLLPCTSNQHYVFIAAMEPHQPLLPTCCHATPTNPDNAGPHIMQLILVPIHCPICYHVPNHYNTAEGSVVLLFSASVVCVAKTSRLDRALQTIRPILHKILKHRDHLNNVQANHNGVVLVHVQPVLLYGHPQTQRRCYRSPHNSEGVILPPQPDSANPMLHEFPQVDNINQGTGTTVLGTKKGGPPPAAALCTFDSPRALLTG